MGLIDRISGLFQREAPKKTARSASSASSTTPAPPPEIQRQMAVAVDKTVIDTEGKLIQTFSNDQITFSGSIVGYDYTSILRDKQANINRLYELSDYFIDSDPIYRGIVLNVYTPYASSASWELIGSDARTKEKYEAYYDNIRLREKIESIMLQYFKYGNVYIYFNEGNLITLPVHKCRIAGVALDGDPVVEFDTESITNSLGGMGEASSKKFIDDEDLEVRLKGYPPEVIEAVKKREKWAQLNPENTFVHQGLKEDWQRYSVPLIASMLPSLGKKALISNYEDSMLNLGARGFVHVAFGESTKALESPMMVDAAQLNQVYRIFSKGMNGFPLVVTNHLAKAEFIQADTRHLYEFDKYKDVNKDILSAGGISDILVAGTSDTGNTFASAQVSMQTAITRIQMAMDSFCEIMNIINIRINGDPKGVTRSKTTKIPRFIFKPIDISSKKALREACLALYSLGVVSDRTLLETHGYDYDNEVARKKNEMDSGEKELLHPEQIIQDSVQNSVQDEAVPQNPNEETRGRDPLPDSERQSDKESAIRGKMPKPSNTKGTPIKE